MITYHLELQLVTGESYEWDNLVMIAIERIIHAYGVNVSEVYITKHRGMI